MYGDAVRFDISQLWCYTCELAKANAKANAKDKAKRRAKKYIHQTKVAERDVAPRSETSRLEQRYPLTILRVA
jgi:hypothetical protein